MKDSLASCRWSKFLRWDPDYFFSPPEVDEMNKPRFPHPPRGHQGSSSKKHGSSNFLKPISKEQASLRGERCLG